MGDRLSAEEVAILIKARQIQKAKGLTTDADVTSICEAAGISRKTGYQWAKGLDLTERHDTVLQEEVSRLTKEYEELKKHCRRLEDINEGHRLAWEIHDVDELLAVKKNTTHKRTRNKP